MDLKGTTALVTGGADGIGAGIAERLAAEGMRVVIADLDEKAGPVGVLVNNERLEMACEPPVVAGKGTGWDVNSARPRRRGPGR
jgi:NAD(P)-dependent dehydrogenase (short-subunit alcohol dehydrogenase family)